MTLFIKYLLCICCVVSHLLSSRNLLYLESKVSGTILTSKMTGSIKHFLKNDPFSLFMLSFVR